MQNPHSDGQHNSPEEPIDLRCAGCEGCEPRLSQASECPGPGGARAVLAPMGLFLFPVLLAILGAMLGRFTAIGELIGGLLGLAAGMATSILAARSAGRRSPGR